MAADGVGDVNDVAFAEMIAATVRTELPELVREVERVGVGDLAQTRVETVARAVVRGVRSVFATLGPLGRNAQRVADVLGRAFARGQRADV